MILFDTYGSSGRQAGPSSDRILGLGKSGVKKVRHTIQRPNVRAFIWRVTDGLMGNGLGGVDGAAIVQKVLYPATTLSEHPHVLSCFLKMDQLTRIGSISVQPFPRYASIS